MGSGNTTANDGSGGRTASPKEMKDGGKKPPYQHGNQNQKTIVPRRHTKFEGKCNEIKGISSSSVERCCGGSTLAHPLNLAYEA